MGEVESMNIDKLTLLNAAGEVCTIGQIRSGQPGIIVLVRHFGCILCRQRIAEIQFMHPSCAAVQRPLDRVPWSVELHEACAACAVRVSTRDRCRA